MEIEFRDQNLEYHDFTGVCLIEAKFYNCNLRFCNFGQSDLSFTLFDNCDLYCADFTDAVIYMTKIINSDATKANFEKSFLNGIRIKDTVVTYTKFGTQFRTGKERKRVKKVEVTDKYLVTEIGKMPMDIISVEKQYEGIYCASTDIVIDFIEPQDKFRIWRRKSEIAKCIKMILEENGYNDKSLEYYYFHRKFLRKSNRSIIKRGTELIWGQLFWGYGVKVSNAIYAFFINCILFSLIYSILSISSDNSGIKMSGEIVRVINECGSFSIVAYFKILYSSILISSLAVFGDIDVVGSARFFAIFHDLISILTIGCGITSMTKKMANV